MPVLRLVFGFSVDERFDFFLFCLGGLSSTSSHSEGLVLVCSCTFQARLPVVSRFSASATNAARSVGFEM